MKENFVNSKKRIDALQKRITEMENERVSKSGVFDFFVNSKTKEENLKIKNQIKSIQDDLEVKIMENGIYTFKVRKTSHGHFRP